MRATAFWLAANCGNIRIMKILKDGGAGPRLASNDGTTPLMAAVALVMAVLMLAAATAFAQ